MIGLSERDREIRDKARSFVDEELIPHEVEAEMNGGRLPEEVVERQRARLRELGLQAPNMPEELGGAALTPFQQVLLSEQIGRATNALGWVLETPAGWLPRVATDHQLETWVKPTIAGLRNECYAITEESAGSDVDAIEATAALEGDTYILNGIKWHVTSANMADYCIFQAKLSTGSHAGSHALFLVDPNNPTGFSLLQLEPGDTVAQHRVQGVHLLVELEGVAQVAPGPLAGTEGVLRHEEVAVEPTSGALVARLDLRALAKRSRVIHLADELPGHGVECVDLPLQR
jgi:alkylation response protein AidB-like acyl-CoA dehydrogenase